MKTNCAVLAAAVLSGLLLAGFDGSTCRLVGSEQCLFAADTADNNMVLNGDFERQQSGGLAGWEPDALGNRVPNDTIGTENMTVRYVWDTVSHGGGKGSLRLDCLGRQEGGKYGGAFGIIATPWAGIPGKPDTEYKLTWFYKAQGLTANSTADTILFFQSPGATRLDGRDSKFLGWKGDHKTADANDWQSCSLTFKTPKGTGWIHLRLQVSSGEPAKKFSAWWDDFVMTPTGGGDAADLPKVPDTWTARPQLQTGNPSGLGDFQMAPPPIPYGSRIQRTMRLLATSTPQQRNRVKILFYGQSIIAQSWWKVIVAELRVQYPHADIVAENPSIGGFMSNWLKDTMYGDCYPACADLIVFHDYMADPASMEEMFANLRRLTTAEVMPMTHHVSWIGNGQYQQAHQKESQRILEWSDKYGFEAVDIRTDWKRYLQYTKSDGWRLLKDIVHLSPAGETLWAKLTMPHFKYLREAKPDWHDRIRVYTPDGKRFVSDRAEYPVGRSLLKEPLRLSFEGSRVDVLAHPAPGAKLGTAKILIDGKAPSSFPELYWATKGSRPPDFFFPMIRRVQLGNAPVLEDWTITFSQIAANGADFQYEVKGSVTGPDGKGNAKEKFVSRSGRLIIDPQWFMIPNLVQMVRKGSPYPDGTHCTVSVRANFTDIWKPQLPQNPASEDRCTLACGLANAPHTLEIIPNGDGDLPLWAIVVHRPPQVAIPAADRPEIKPVEKNR